MAYTYKFIPSGDPIQKSPKETFIDNEQSLIRRYFYESSDWFTIKEETSLASGLYQDVDVRVNNLVNPTTGDNVEMDYKKILFPELDHSVNLGRMYQFDNNYWITTNIDKIKTLTQTVLVKRCNNVLRWIDEATGAYYQVPCSISYLIKENRDYSTAGSAIVVPSGMVECIVQINSMSRKIKPNQRFLVGNSENWTAYRVEGGGLNYFNNQETFDNDSAGMGRLSLAVDYTNVNEDDLVNGIANFYSNEYVLTLSETSISGGATQQVQLYATVTLNEDTVSRTVTWESSNVAIATVSSTGLVTFVSDGSCTITCSLANNSTIYDTASVTVNASPSDTYQVIVSPDKNYILEGSTQEWEVYLYKNGVVQSDVFTFTLDPQTVPSENYTYLVTGDNSFSIKNVEKYLLDNLVVECVSGSYNKSISVFLRGAW